MKKLSIFFTFFIGAYALSQTGIKFEEGNFASILAKAKKESKPVFIDAYTSWCGPCKLMAKSIFPLATVGDYYNTHFINFKIDMEKGEGLKIAKKYNIKSYPTYLFLDEKGEEIHRTVGYAEENEFIQFAKDANDPNKRLPALKKKFENGESSPEFLKNLAVLAGMSDDRTFASKVLERYFSTQPAITSQDITQLMMNIESMEDPLYKVFQNKKEDIIKITSKNDYEEFDKGIKLKYVYKKAYNKSTKVLDENYYLTEVQKFLEKKEAEKNLQDLKANIALDNKDYKTYEKIMLKMYENYSNVEPMDLGFAAWGFANNDITNKSSIEKAVLWAHKAIEKQPQVIHMLTLARLYNKIGDKKNAKIWAEKSIGLAKTSGHDSSEAEEFLKKL
ncbi:thiol:disulfide interchange protein [Chryseobacterium sp. MYb7]|uniref:thioredoxin family protein n=1 Tax=Chryseobacterium sp. MYb7 TaxID=1827290 RepID=UPI000D0057BE|nr:thioredoxin family protein [Chryseobacterium sp. MYb7]PRA92485.1 thiol:disulfide interchange protein [Chryseobacterium sp. MYb7]